MLAFEQIETHLHKWARHFSNNQFDHWELINAVWAKGGVQKLPNVKLASARIRYDMLDYIRVMAQTRVRARDENYPKAVNFSSLAGMAEDDNHDNKQMDSIGSIEDSQKLDTKDYFDWALRGLTREEKLVIILRYQCDYTVEEIGKVVGVTPSMISIICKSVLKRIKAKLVRAGERPRQCLRKTIFSRNEEGRRSYSREYYLDNKEIIRAWQKKYQDKRKSA